MGFIGGDVFAPGEFDSADTNKRLFTFQQGLFNKSIKIHIVSTTDPKKAWKVLEDQFPFVSLTQIVRLARKFYAMTMKP